MCKDCGSSVKTHIYTHAVPRGSGQVSPAGGAANSTLLLSGASAASSHLWAPWKVPRVVSPQAQVSFPGCGSAGFGATLASFKLHGRLCPQCHVGLILTASQGCRRLHDSTLTRAGAAKASECVCVWGGGMEPRAMLDNRLCQSRAALETAFKRGLGGKQRIRGTCTHWQVVGSTRERWGPQEEAPRSKQASDRAMR